MKVFFSPDHEGKSVVEFVSRPVVLSLLQEKHTDKMKAHWNLSMLGEKKMLSSVFHTMLIVF